ncbi:YkyA family protein [Paenibacillus sp. OK003]|uniref:YkyA family protein n=1 Tax=Paenibacillus sp. OK003 TaxID=1884380 RepID=UPI0008C4CEB0|nr:YkyA family protein [Paenibacillus sp. OK003]SEM04819.1 Putative cell-wall binding lipoprotein [Paenibacillus sp. OK003]
MLKRKKIALAGVSILLALLVSACGKPQEPAANQVNQLILTDQEMNQSLKELVHHEREDMELYGSILSKGKNKNSNLEALLDQADGHIAERRTLLEQAEAVMSRTKEQMEELRTSLDQLSFEKEENLAQAHTVLDQYEQRAASFAAFVASYKQSLDADEQLYALMRGNVEPNLVKIKRAIRERNSQYAKVAELRQQFNKQTKAFNGANAKLVKMEQAG